MSFTEGFKSGFGIYSTLASLEEDKKLTESKIETERLRQQAYKEDIEATEESRKFAKFGPSDIPMVDGKPDLSGLSFAEREIYYKSKKGEFDVNVLMPKLEKEADIKIEAAETKLGSEKIQLELAQIGISDTKAQRAVQRLANAVAVSSESGDPITNASIFEEVFIAAQSYGVNFIDYAQPEYQGAWARLSPKMEAGDFEGIVRENADDLSTVHKRQLQGYVGKQFQNENGKIGRISSVKFSGDFDPIEGGRNLVIGGQFEVYYEGDKQPTTEFSYLPDNSEPQKIIKQDRSADDAKSVSVADIVDITAAHKEIAAEVMQNENLRNTLLEVSKGAVSFEGNSYDVAEMTKITFDLKKSGEERIKRILKEATKAGEKDEFNSESAYLGYIYEEEPSIAMQFIDKNVEPLGTNFSLKDGSTVADIENSLVARYANPAKIKAQVQDAFSSFGRMAKRDDGRRLFYFYDGVPFDRNMKKEEFDFTAKELVRNYESLKAEAKAARDRAYGQGSFENLKGEEYLSYMTAYLDMRRGT